MGIWAIVSIIGVILSAVVFTLFLKKSTKNLDKIHREIILTDSLKLGITLTAAGTFGLLILLAFGK